ncbi:MULTISPECIES: MAPEG family protein [Caulobacter]|jgi:uncharacterized membrane protein YecN with MAPEG domain|uniref:MAPEG family protein n=1 Tax=Caulobacter TaxID=75 RepID=UPI0013D2ECA5|nr:MULTISPECIES: MAPEG family protein [Caulobacter]MDR7114501.1 putative membrane protein YecN with MAPEG domain [Caulobacter sp. BE254]GGL10050.1 hypothetical protein GCM10010983_04020 [Caulobacter rhizosphaerae]
MADLPITSLFAGGFALALVGLSLMVTLRRVKTTILLGEGDDIGLRRRIRAQANFIEYVPLGIIVLTLMELRGLPAVGVLSLGTALAVGRLLHAVGMYRDAPVLRGLGILATYAVLAGGGVAVILSAV